MYILIIFQFTICVLAGIGLNDYTVNIKKNNGYKTISRIIVIILSLISSIYIFKNQLINFNSKNIQLYGAQNHNILDPIRLNLIDQ